MEPLTHFHRVETFLWYDVSALLRALVLTRIETPEKPLRDLMSDTATIDVASFIRQMNVGYLHPRRNALHRRLCGATSEKKVCQSFYECKPKSISPDL